MKKINDFCRKFYCATFFPIHFFDNDKNSIYSYPTYAEEISITDTINNKLASTNKNPDYIITDSLSYLGIIKIAKSNNYVIIGPMFSTPVSDNTLSSFMHEFAIPFKLKQSVSQYLQNSPTVSFNQFMNILSFIHLAINNKNVNDSRYINESSNNYKDKISKIYSENMFITKENNDFHNTYLFEQQYLKYIKNGQPEKLKLFMHKEGASLAYKEGILADNALRQAQNIFIAAVTTATRSSIAGGLDVEKAYQLSDIYIQESEHMQSITSISKLSSNMLIDFAEQVSHVKVPKGISDEIFKCTQFISQHTNETITVNDVADFINRSRSYTSKKFKKEVGIDLSKYIMQCKLDDAKDLLEHSDKSLSDISNYLCFSSQAYFHNVFKKYYGITPLEQRTLKKK